MLRPDYPIVTARLLLRPFTEDDFDALHDIYSRPEVNRYLYSEPYTPERTRETLAERISKTTWENSGDWISLAVRRRDSPQLIGTGRLTWDSAEHEQGEIGYTLHPDHQGKGYATEVATTLITIGFRDAKLHRICGHLDARNGASARVLEKAGMRREAHLVENEFVKGEWTDDLVYALLRTEWENSQVGAEER